MNDREPPEDEKAEKDHIKPGQPLKVAEKPTPGSDFSKILLGVALSIFVCPGLGHKLVGRNLAFKVVLILFFSAFLFLCFFVYGLVQTSLSEILSQPQINLNTVFSLLSKNLTYGTGTTISFFVLVIVYIGAPIELLLTGIYRHFSIY